jgi:hypothetical protein
MIDKYNFEKLNEIYSVDADSPSGLVWKNNRYGGRNNKRIIRSAGSQAGTKEGELKSNSRVHSWRTMCDKQHYQVHRIIWVLLHGNISEDKVIDHLDGNPFNNEISNLCLKTVRENNQNIRLSIRNKSSVCGVFMEYCYKRKKHVAWTATWNDINSKLCRKRFNFSIYSPDTAFNLAVQFRKERLEELKQCGMSYTDRHGVSPLDFKQEHFAKCNLIE